MNVGWWCVTHISSPSMGMLGIMKSRHLSMRENSAYVKGWERASMVTRGGAEIVGRSEKIEERRERESVERRM